MNAGFELSSLDCGNIWQLEDKSTHGWWLFQMKRLSQAKCPAQATPPRTKKAATCRPRLASPHTTTKVSAFPTQHLPDRLVDCFFPTQCSPDRPLDSSFPTQCSPDRLVQTEETWYCFRIFCLRIVLTFWKRLIFLEKCKFEITFWLCLCFTYLLSMFLRLYIYQFYHTYF